MNKKKRLICIVVAFVIIAFCVLSAVLSSRFRVMKEDAIERINEREELSRFTEISQNYISGGDVVIFYDKETKVMYLSTDDGIEVMVDENGEPLLYEENE